MAKHKDGQKERIHLRPDKRGDVILLKNKNRAKIKSRIKNDWMLYLMFFPVLAWYIAFCYAPMGGLVLAFKDYSIKRGMWGSEWVGLKNFVDIFSDKMMFRAIKNTLILSFGGLMLSMPCEIGLALLLNELRMPRAKKFVQTAVTFPHFISWIVLSGILSNLFSSVGSVTQLLALMGIDFTNPMNNAATYRWFLWISDIWKEVGWGSIIYLAAISSVDQTLYEAACIDGASRLQQIWHITLSTIRSTVCIMLILAVGSLITSGRFDQIYNTYSPMVYSVGDTIDTYIYRESFGSTMDFGYSTAVGMVRSIVGVAMLLITNKIVTKLGEQGVF